MPILEPEIAAKFQPELASGENLLWTGKPDPSVIFHSEDWLMVPFSLLWGGFAIFWEASVLGYVDFNSKPARHGPLLFGLWGIPFVLLGQYIIWGRFVCDAWLKRRTYYAVTNRRVILVQQTWKRKIQFIFFEAIPSVTTEGNDPGTLWLGEKLPLMGGRKTPTRGWSRFYIDQRVPVLADIDNLHSVYRLILELREKARKESSPSVSGPLTYRDQSQ